MNFRRNVSNDKRQPHILFWKLLIRNVATKELAQRFPALLHVVNQQLFLWVDRLHSLVVLAISLFGDNNGFWIHSEANIWGKKRKLDDRVHFLRRQGNFLPCL